MDLQHTPQDNAILGKIIALALLTNAIEDSTRNPLSTGHPIVGAGSDPLLDMLQDFARKQEEAFKPEPKVPHDLNSLLESLGLVLPMEDESLKDHECSFPAFEGPGYSIIECKSRDSIFTYEYIGIDGEVKTINVADLIENDHPIQPNEDHTFPLLYISVKNDDYRAYPVKIESGVLSIIVKFESAKEMHNLFRNY